MPKKTKIDLRLNEIRDAIKEIAEAHDNFPLTDRAIAVLICDANKSLKISQVEAVFKELPRLRDKYLKEE